MYICLIEARSRVAESRAWVWEGQHEGTSVTHQNACQQCGGFCVCKQRNRKVPFSAQLVSWTDREQTTFKRGKNALSAYTLRTAVRPLKPPLVISASHLQ